MKRSLFDKTRKLKNQILAKRKRYSIDRILWSSFALFAVFILLALNITQIIMTRNTMISQVKDNLEGCVSETYRFLEQGAFEPALEQYIYRSSVDKNVNIFILDEDGNVNIPNWVTSDVNYADRIQELKEEYPDFEENRGVILRNTDTIYYIGRMQRGNPYYLTISVSLQSVNRALRVTNIQIIFISVLAVIAAFLISGMIAMRLSKPITEMTEKAKELESGNFEVDFSAGESYYQEIYGLGQGLNNMRDALHRSDQMQKELIANVSHDMKTPLTMIKAYASMIIEISGNNKEKREKHAQVIIDESDRLTNLVNEVLQISKIQAGIDTLKCSVFNLSEFTYGIISKFDYLTEMQGYQFILDIDSDLYTNADKDKIGQVIYNLIGNAINYTGDDKKVVIHLKQEKDVIHFRVIDTGAGIPPEQIETIWDRYYRSKETHKRPIQGTGLGLSIVKTICEKHNLHFGVKSKVGTGSMFFVDFKLSE